MQDTFERTSNIKYVSMTQDEIRNKTGWSKENENLYRLLNSVENESNRRGYEPLTDEENKFLKDNGYIRAKSKGRGLSEKGRTEYNELSKIYREWDLIMFSRYDNVQEMVMDGKFVSPEVLIDYPDLLK